MLKFCDKPKEDRPTQMKKCKKCGGKVCICEDNGMWAAHCMDCDNAIGIKDGYDPCALTKEEAEIRWNKMNEICDKPTEGN